MSEAALQAAVIGLARLLGYRVAHFRPAETKQGWRTPVQADGKGFPDLVLVRAGRLLFVELKAARGRISAEQGLWLETLATVQADGLSIHVWQPIDWTSGLVERVLRGGPPAVRS